MVCLSEKIYMHNCIDVCPIIGTNKMFICFAKQVFKQNLTIKWDFSYIPLLAYRSDWHNYKPRKSPLWKLGPILL